MRVTYREVSVLINGLATKLKCQVDLYQTENNGVVLAYNFGETVGESVHRSMTDALGSFFPLVTGVCERNPAKLIVVQTTVFADKAFQDVICTELEYLFSVLQDDLFVLFTGVRRRDRSWGTREIVCGTDASFISNGRKGVCSWVLETGETGYSIHDGFRNVGILEVRSIVDLFDSCDILRDYDRITVFSDSTYAVESFNMMRNGGNLDKLMPEVHDSLLILKGIINNDFPHTTISCDWVKGHSGSVGNKPAILNYYADRLCQTVNKNRNRFRPAVFEEYQKLLSHACRRNLNLLNTGKQDDNND